MACAFTLAFVYALTSTLWQTRTSDDGKGTYREMTLNGSVIVENIYLNDQALEVTFVKTDGQGEVQPPPLNLQLPYVVVTPPLPPQAALQLRPCRPCHIPARAQVRPA